MSEIPLIKLPEKYSGLTNVERINRILKQIYNPKFGNIDYVKNEVEYLLYELTDYVTLIGWDTLPLNYSVKDSATDYVHVYYYNEEFIKIIGLQIIVNNDYKRRPEFFEKLEKYKMNCLWSNKCLVYNIDNIQWETIYKLNLELSNPEYVIPELLREEIKLVIGKEYYL